MADIPFPRVFGTYERSGKIYGIRRDADWAVEFVHHLTAQYWHRNPCANGMPSHPPCRSPAELEALLRAQGDTTAARESV